MYKLQKKNSVIVNDSLAYKCIQNDPVIVRRVQQVAKKMKIEKTGTIKRRPQLKNKDEDVASTSHHSIDAEKYDALKKKLEDSERKLKISEESKNRCLTENDKKMKELENQNKSIVEKINDLLRHNEQLTKQLENSKKNNEEANYFLDEKKRKIDELTEMNESKKK